MLVRLSDVVGRELRLVRLEIPFGKPQSPIQGELPSACGLLSAARCLTASRGESLTLSTETTTRTGGVLAATCLSTLVVNAKTSAVSIALGD